MKSIQEMLDRLALNGGCIVSSADCDVIEIDVARQRGDMYVDHYGFGYILRLPKWLAQHDPYCRASQKAEAEKEE
jgi:hypothetical protein